MTFSIIFTFCLEQISHKSPINVGFRMEKHIPLLCLRAKQLVISLLKEFKLPLFSSLFGISRKTIVSQVPFLAIFRITMRGTKGWVDGPTSQSRLQLLSAGRPAVGCLKSQRQSLICKKGHNSNCPAVWGQDQEQWSDGHEGTLHVFTKLRKKSGFPLHETAI